MSMFYVAFVCHFRLGGICCVHAQEIIMYLLPAIRYLLPAKCSIIRADDAAADAADIPAPVRH